MYYSDVWWLARCSLHIPANDTMCMWLLHKTMFYPFRSKLFSATERNRIDIKYEYKNEMRAQNNIFTGIDLMLMFADDGCDANRWRTMCVWMRNREKILIFSILLNSWNRRIVLDRNFPKCMHYSLFRRICVCNLTIAKTCSRVCCALNSLSISRRDEKSAEKSIRDYSHLRLCCLLHFRISHKLCSAVPPLWNTKNKII